MRISDWSSDVCSSDLPRSSRAPINIARHAKDHEAGRGAGRCCDRSGGMLRNVTAHNARSTHLSDRRHCALLRCQYAGSGSANQHLRSEEHTSELQSLMRISYAVFCLKKKIKKTKPK